MGLNGFLSPRKIVRTGETLMVWQMMGSEEDVTRVTKTFATGQRSRKCTGVRNPGKGKRSRRGWLTHLGLSRRKDSRRKLLRALSIPSPITFLSFCFAPVVCMWNARRIYGETGMCNIASSPSHIRFGWTRDYLAGAVLPIASRERSTFLWFIFIYVM